ncbi:MAG: glutathione S-transferase family protein [Alphaproteobacteria bacterium]|nr:glutathione S-transferase family protein [Alphaproteobacteria bacterium]
MGLKLYTFPPSPRSFKVLWAANQLGIDYEFELVDFSKQAQKAPEFLALNPNGRAPVLEHDGYVLWESNAIVEYLASLKPQSGAMPSDVRAQNAVRKWLYWDSAHWDPACAIFAFERVVKPLFGLGETNEAEIARGMQLFQNVGAVLEGELKKHRYVAGETLTVADLAIGSALSIAERARFPTESFRNILRWQADLTSLPSWKKTVAMQQMPSA